MLETGEKIKLKFGGGHIGIITNVKYECSYSMEGRPVTGLFTEVELEKTTEDPEPLQMGFRVSRENDD